MGFKKIIPLSLVSIIILLDKLVAYYATAYPNRVFTGDTEAFSYFRKNYLSDLQAEPGHEGIFYLHPNKKGVIVLGGFWGIAIERVLRKLS